MDYRFSSFYEISLTLWPSIVFDDTSKVGKTVHLARHIEERPLCDQLKAVDMKKWTPLATLFGRTKTTSLLPLQLRGKNKFLAFLAYKSPSNPFNTPPALPPVQKASNFNSFFSRWDFKGKVNYIRMTLRNQLEMFYYMTPIIHAKVPWVSIFHPAFTVQLTSEFYFSLRPSLD